MCGGGGSGPTETKSTTSNIPDYAQPYVMGNGTIPGLLPQTSALTDINQNPYKPYTGQMIAGFNPMQQQSMNTVQGMTPSNQTSQATGMAGLAGLNAGNIGSTYNPGQIGSSNVNSQQFNGANVNQYMNPYVQDVVQQQQNQAVRGYAQQLPGMGAVAAETGNLGGSRQALVQSEAQRNLQDQLQGITAQGYGNAYQNAQGQFNTSNAANMQAQQANQGAGLAAQGQGLQSQQFGSNLGLQGLNTQLGAAGQLGTLGNNQYQQQAGIAQAQFGLGQQAQDLQQTGMNTAYQQFINQQNYPYAQLGFMSDILHGTGTIAQGSGTASTYQQPPNVLGQVAGVGTGLAALFNAGAS